jgi:hypothetical protein
MVVPQWLVQLLLRHQLLNSRPAVPDPHVEARILHDREHHLRGDRPCREQDRRALGLPEGGQQKRRSPTAGKGGGDTSRGRCGRRGGQGAGEVGRGRLPC